MRKHLLVLGLFCCWCAFGQQPAPARETASQQVAAEDEQSGLMKWKLINTSIFVVLLGFAVFKLAPRFFQARSLDIQKAIKDATGLKIEADFRYSEIDKKMANLSGEVARMKAEAATEIEREHQRLQRETAEEIEHMGRNTDYEIDSLRAEGAQQVRRHTAQLAFGLAERRLQAHFAQDEDQNNVHEFVNLVGSGKAEGRN